MEQVQDYHRWLMYGHSSIWELRSIWYVNVCAVIEAIEVLVTHIDFAIQKTQNINQIPSTKSLKYLTNDENGYSDINLLLSLLESFSEKKKKNCLNKPSKWALEICESTITYRQNSDGFDWRDQGLCHHCYHCNKWRNETISKLSHQRQWAHNYGFISLNYLSKMICFILHWLFFHF